MKNIRKNILIIWSVVWPILSINLFKIYTNYKYEEIKYSEEIIMPTQVHGDASNVLLLSSLVIMILNIVICNKLKFNSKLLKVLYITYNILVFIGLFLFSVGTSVA